MRLSAPHRAPPFPILIFVEASVASRHTPTCNQIHCNKMYYYYYCSIFVAYMYYQQEKSFSHHYQGRIDFNTVNLFHSAGMDLACILASREGLTNPLPRGKIDQSSPCRGLSTRSQAMNTQLVFQC